ncbi:MAG: sulfatase-like hydrolase/transferase [Bacteroidetes bacterium]|nr:sulfatase-like hydrolase/transferase [Bacteroidota bacterium]
MKAYLKYPIFLFLLPLFFFLVGYTEHGSFLHLHKMAIPYLCLYGGIGGCYCLLNIVKRQPNKNALWVLYVATVYLFFGNIKGRFDAVFTTGSYTIFCLTILLLPIATLLLLRKFPKLEKQLFSYANALLLALCITQGILVTLAVSKPDTYQLSTINFKENKCAATPSIHLILWDGYPGFRSLEKYFNFDNNDIKQKLKNKKYVVFDSINSNYFQTYFSINALLNMQYISYLHQVPLNQYYNVLHQLEQINDNQFTQFLIKNKYRIYNNAIFELGNQAVLNNNPKFKSAEQIHFNETLPKRLQKDFLWRFAKGKFKMKFAEEQTVLNQYNQNNATINRFFELKPTHPHFTYSHIIMPHEPYYTDSAGHFLNRAKAAKANNESLFINYIKYTNTLIDKMASHLQKQEPNSIIIIMSDHGYREYLQDSEIPLKFNNFLAIHLPDSNYANLSKMKSTQNLFRILLNQYFDQELPMLEDSCIAINEEKKQIISTKL